MKKTILILLCIVLAAASVMPVLAAGYTVDTSEDYRALGYVDTRKIVRDGDGNLYVAYRKKHNSIYQIFVSKSTDGGSTWNVTNGGKPISEVPGGYHQRVPSIAIDSHDNLHVVWYGKDTTYDGAEERQIKYSQSIDGGSSWSAWRNIAPVSGYSGQKYWQEHPVIYIDGNDNLYVVWEGRDADHPDSTQTKFTKSTNGGSDWSSWMNVNARSSNQSRPTIVVDSNGHIYIMAYGYWNGEQNILWTKSTNGGSSFNSWQAVAANSGKDQRHPSACIDTSDKIYLVYREERSDGKSEIKFAVYNSGWGSPSTISYSSGYYQFFPSICNYGGKQHVVWTETQDSSGFPSENPSTGRIVYAKRESGLWTKSNVTSYSDYTWASIRWSSHRMNGGNIDIVYSSGSSSPYSIKYESLGPLNSTSPSSSKLAVSSITASPDDGNGPYNTIDGDFSTRWSSEGDGAWIQYDLGLEKNVDYVKIAWYKGDERMETFDIDVSINGSDWTQVFSGTSSGSTTGFETYDFSDVSARYVKIVGHGNTYNDWNSITETEIYGQN